MIKTVLLGSILAAFLSAGAASAQEFTITTEAFGHTFDVPAPAPAPAPARPRVKIMALAGGAAPAQTFQAFGHTFEYPNAH